MPFSKLSLPSGYRILNTIAGACMGILSPFIQPLLNIYCKSQSDTPQEKRLWPSIIIQVADIYVLCAIFVFLRTPSSLVSTALANSGLSYIVLGMPCLLGALHGANKGYALQPAPHCSDFLEIIWKWPPPVEAKDSAPVLHVHKIRPSLLSTAKSIFSGSACGVFLCISMPLVQSFRRIQEADYPSLQYLSDTINFYASIKAGFIVIGLFQLSPAFCLVFPTTLGVYGIFRGGHLGYRLDLTFNQESLALFSSHILEGGFDIVEPALKQAIQPLPGERPKIKEKSHSTIEVVNLEPQSRMILQLYSPSKSSERLYELKENPPEWVEIDLSSPSKSETGISQHFA